MLFSYNFHLMSCMFTVLQAFYNIAHTIWMLNPALLFCFPPPPPPPLPPPRKEFLFYVMVYIKSLTWEWIWHITMTQNTFSHTSGQTTNLLTLHSNSNPFTISASHLHHSHVREIWYTTVTQNTFSHIRGKLYIFSHFTTT